MNQVTQIFTQLVQIPSPSGKEEKVRNYVVSRIKQITDRISVDKIGNLYAYVKGSTPSILLCAHLDTVEPTGFQKPVIKDGFIYSNGKYILGADNKAGVASILAAILFLVNEKRPYRSFELLFTVREETEAGIRYFPRNKIISKHGLIADLSLPIGNIVVAAPFVIGYSITIKSLGAHVSQISTNTIHPLSFLKEFIKIIPFGRLNKDTIINIGKISMGENYNSVPLQLYFTGELRTFNKQYYANFIKLLKKTNKQLSIKYKLKSQLDLYPYSYGYSLTHKDLIQTKKIFSSMKIPFNPTKTFSVGDFSILNEWGIKTINIGNDNIDAHKPTEHIAIQSLEKLVEIIENHLKT